MRIGELKPADEKTGYPGQRFRTGGEEPYTYGRLLRLGAGAAIVRYEKVQQKTITQRRGREIVRSVTFKSSPRPGPISLGTEVVPVPEEV